MAGRPRASLGVAAALALGVLGGCGDAADGPAARDVPEPTVEDLVIPPPEDAAFDARLTASRHSFLEAQGGLTRRRMGTEGTWEGDDLRIHVFLSDRPLEEVRDHYADLFRERGELEPGRAGPNTGAIREEALSMGPPEALEEAIEEYGLELPPGFVERYREAYPRLEGVTGSYVEFVTDDAEADTRRDSHREVEVRIVRPYLDPDRIELHDRTGIIYTLVTMRRADARR